LIGVSLDDFGYLFGTDYVIQDEYISYPAVILEDIFQVYAKINTNRVTEILKRELYD